MATSSSRGVITRRGLLAGGFAAGALLATNPARAASRLFRKDAPLRIGLQSYSLRGYQEGGKPNRARALAVTNQLGVNFWEAFPAHLPMTDDAGEIQRMRDELRGAEVGVVGYGVIPFKKGDAGNRKAFEFAKAMKISYLSADPDPDCFDELDKLIEEFDVAIGIHNHGPGHRYDKIDVIDKAIKDHHPKFGCCVDTGHFLRSKEDPVRAAEVFGKRVFGVHLKDVKDAEHFTILGRGDMNTPGLFRVLIANGYDGLVAIEYEESEENPVDDIRACLQEVDRVFDAVG